MLRRALRTAAFLALAALAAASLPDRAAEAQTAQTVKPGWQYIPSGISPGQSFRLLFVTSSSFDARGFGSLNGVATKAAGSNVTLRPFKDEFRILGSTSTVHARDNTGTTGTGVPIYWLGGAKVADDYADLYDGSWDSRAGKTEFGGNYTGLVWTGTLADGSSGGNNAIGSGGNVIIYGALNRGPGKELFSSGGAPTTVLPFYALSPVITVQGPPKVSLVPGSTSIDESGTNNATTLKATLPEAVPSSTTVTLSATPSGKVTFGGTTLTIPANATESGTVTVTAVDNDVSAPDAQVTVSGSVSGTAVAAPDDITLTVRDDEGPPAKPAGLAATAGDGQVTLSWTDPGNASITKYQYQRRASTGLWGGWTDIPSSAPGEANATSWTVTGLTGSYEIGGVTARRSYRFRIRAVNAQGTGSQSDDTGWVWLLQASTPAPTIFGPSAAPPAEQKVPKNWQYLPSGFTVGQKFRLLFVTSKTRDATSSNIADYNRFVQQRAGTNGRLARFKSHFRADHLHRRGVRPEQHRDLRRGRGRLLAGRGEGRRRLQGLLRRKLGLGEAQVTETGNLGGSAGQQCLDSGSNSQRNEACHGSTPAAKSTMMGSAVHVSGRVQPARACLHGPSQNSLHLYALSPVISVVDAVELHGVEVSGFKAEADDEGAGSRKHRLKATWQVRKPSHKRCRYLLAWHETGTEEAWRHKVVYSHSSRPSFHIDSLKAGTQYTVQLFVAEPGKAAVTRPADRAYETTATTGGQSLAPPPIQAAGPALSWARVNGAEMALRFDAALDESSVPAGSAFAVSVAGAPRTVSGVSVSQATVTLTLASAVTSGQAVTVGYAPPATGGLRASGGGAAVAAFTGQPAANDTGSLQRQAPPPAPLTARVANAPAEHRGRGRFTVTVAFSDAVAGNAKAATQTIQVTGGTLTRVRRAGGADRWALDIAPSGHAAVTLTLPAATDCAVRGAACTADGRRLETALTHTVPGPVTLSVADARAQEGAGATIDFAVTLSRAASQEVTVRYRTRNGTAKAGRDYRKATGTLSFAAGETAKTVSVAVLDDAHDEGAETFRLLLSRPRGAVIADGEATGTIANDDPMPAAWLARFGRTVAVQATDAVRARLEAGAEAPGHLTLAGQRVGAGADVTDAERALARRASEDAEAAAWATRVVARLADGEADPEAGARTLSGRDLLAGSSFLLPVGGADGPSWALWGRGAIGGFEGSRDGMTLDGEVATLMLGLDRTQGPATLGVMVSRNAGRGMYRPADGNGAGEIEATMTGLFPYAGLGAGDRLSLWAMAGRAEGVTALTPPGERRIEADTELTMAALGARAVLKAAPEGGLELAVAPDAMAVRTTSEAVPGLAASRSDVTRLRLGLEGAWRGGGFVPTLGLALRHDGGDAETGFGIEASGGVAWSDPGSGFSVELKGRTLFAHADDDVRERGISFALVRAPGPKGRGASLALTAARGADAPAADRLLSGEPLAATLSTKGDAREVPERLSAEFGYGMPAFRGRFTGTPRARVALSDAAREWRLGWDLAPAWRGAPDLGLGLAATRREADGGDPEHEVGIEIRATW